MLDSYFPILLFIFVGLGIGIGPLILGKILSPHNPDDQKTHPMSVALKHLKMLG